MHGVLVSKPLPSVLASNLAYLAGATLGSSHLGNMAGRHIGLPSVKSAFPFAVLPRHPGHYSLAISAT